MAPSASVAHRASTLIDSLNVDAPDAAAVAARAIKNAIIANPTNKKIYVDAGVIPSLVRCVPRNFQLHPLLVQNVVASLGSLSPHISAPQVVDVANVLIHCLSASASDLSSIYACVRSLKLLLLATAARFPSLPIFDSLIHIIVQPVTISTLLLLLNSSDEGIAEVCAIIITHIVEHDSERRFIQTYAEHEHDIIAALISLINKSSHQRCVQACINALNSLANISRDISVNLISTHSIIPSLLNYVSPPSPSLLRLAACRLLTTFDLYNLLPKHLDTSLTSALSNLLSYNHDDFAALDVNARTLSSLIMHSPDLQTVAFESGALVNLSAILASVYEGSDKDRKKGAASDNMTGKSLLDKDVIMNDISVTSAPSPEKDSEEEKLHLAKQTLKASVLNAIAACTDQYELARDAVVAIDLLPIIVTCLHEKNKDVLKGSISCIRSLSRSVKILRRDLTDTSIGSRLVCLLNDESVEIVQLSSAALCNVVVEFSPIRKTVLDNGAIHRIVELLHGKDPIIRKNSVWVLKNLLFKADMETKNMVLAKLGYDTLKSLFSDKDPKVRALAMTIMRNLACSTTADMQNEQLDNLFATIGEELISTLSHVLNTESISQSNDGDGDKRMEFTYNSSTDSIKKRSNSSSGSNVYGSVNNSDRKPSDQCNSPTRTQSPDASKLQLSDGRPETNNSQTNIELIIQTLYVVCNIASGTEKHKTFLLQSDIPQLILRWTCHRDDRIRIAAVWCTINLSWRDRMSPASRAAMMPRSPPPGTRNLASASASSPPPRRHTRALRRSYRSAADRRNVLAAGRLHMLRRQHLPLPASPASRRILGAHLSSDGGNDDMWVVDSPDLMDDDAASTHSEDHNNRTTNNNGNISNETNNHNGNNDDTSNGRNANDSNSNNANEINVDNNNPQSSSEPNDTPVESTGADPESTNADPMNDDGYEASGSVDGSAGEGSNSSAGKGGGYKWRIERLRQLGFEGRLRSLINDPHIEVQGRAREALQLLDCKDVQTLDYNPSSLLIASRDYAL